MSGYLTVPTVAQRGALFAIVAGAHLVFLAMLALARVEVPPVGERTIAVELLPMAAGGAAAPAQSKAASPLPRPLPDRSRPVSKPVLKASVFKEQMPVAKAPAPQPDLTASALPSESAIALPSPSISPSPSASGTVSVSTPAGGNVDGVAASGGSSVAGVSSSGDGSSQARFDAGYLRNPAPPYPAISRRMREEGKVTLRVLVTPHGTAESVEVKTSSGSVQLDEAASRTVRQWRFVPARRGDTAVQSWVLVPVIFKLEQ